jgi:acetyl-CoA carboxylase biotin carboxyl carrier protein
VTSSYPEVETVARLLQLTAQYGLEELEVEEGGVRVRLVAGDHVIDPDGEGVVSANSILWRPPAWPGGPDAAEAESPAQTVAIRAPLTGTFYTSSNPESPAFVEVGDTVEEGQVVGIIEAMKVFSEVLADRAGTVRRIVAQNGKITEQGDIILYLEPEDGIL